MIRKILGFCRQMAVSRYYYDIHFYRWESWGSQSQVTLSLAESTGSTSSVLLYTVILLTIWKRWEEEKLSDLRVCNDCILSSLLSGAPSIFSWKLCLFSVHLLLWWVSHLPSQEILEDTRNVVHKSLLSISHNMWMEAFSAHPFWDWKEEFWKSGVFLIVL